jgi:hypothetical protein
MKKNKLNRKYLLIAGLILALVVIGAVATFASSPRRAFPGKIGAYAPTYGEYIALEKKIGVKFDSFLWYQAITQDFDTNLGGWLKADGHALQLAWEPRDPSGDPVNQPNYTLKNIASGKHDDRIRALASQLRSYGGVVYFRPMSEMNGDWASWSGTKNGNVPSDYIVQEGATNVKFVWSPNNRSYPSTATNDLKVYFPGDNYVDYVGISGYNQGKPEESFEKVFGLTYDKISRLSRKPFIISETATYDSYRKAAWINSMNNSLTSGRFKRVSQVYWFSANKEKDWRVDSSPASLVAFKNFMRGGAWKCRFNQWYRVGTPNYPKPLNKCQI